MMLSIEDMGVLFIDPRCDGDLDLFVVSGGVECEPGDNILQDRIYINDGFGNFSKGQITAAKILRLVAVLLQLRILIRMAQEIFIGGRVIPGSYPLKPEFIF